MKFNFSKTAVFLLAVTALFLNSCSSSDDASDPEVVFTSIKANKTNAFIEDKITLTLEGSGYTDAMVTTTNTNVKIAKAANGIFEVSSSKAGYITLYAELKNNTKKQIKTIDVIFAEHGILNFKTVEGITVDVDKSSKVLSLFGEPDVKNDNTDGTKESWNYVSKGVSFLVIKNSLIVDQISVFRSNYYNTIDGVQKFYTTYKYELGNGWKINSTTMGDVVKILGTPTLINTNREHDQII